MAIVDTAALRVALRERGFASVSSDILASVDASSDAEFESVRDPIVAVPILISSRTESRDWTDCILALISNCPQIWEQKHTMLGRVIQLVPPAHLPDALVALRPSLLQLAASTAAAAEAPCLHAAHAWAALVASSAAGMRHQDAFTEDYTHTLNVYSHSF
jgi:hypothetical protein